MLRNPGKYWKDVLKIDRLSNSSKKFGFSIKTDGVSVRVHFKKTCFTTDLGKDGFKTFGDKEYVQLDVENKRVVGLDPGRKDIFSCFDGTKAVHCSNKEWQEISDGFKTFGDKEYVQLDVENKRVVGLDPGRKDMFCCHDGSKKSYHCSGKLKETKRFVDFKKGRYPDFKFWYAFSQGLHCQKFSQYLGVVLENHSHLFHFYGSLKWRQLRRKTDIRRQKAYDVLCKRIAGEKLDSIVAYGSAKFSASSRGSPPIPTTRLYKKLLQRNVCVRLVWEHRTSVVCSVCHNDLPKGKKWRVKICPTCKIYLNRDVNAASNIRQIFLFMNGNNGQRPMQFKTFKQRMLASSASNPAVPNDGQQADDRGEENTLSDIPAQIPL
ncbi:hypothetical protein MP638_003878 [Amoeboaphelidium occidentale]|nr:hypothetical protein MP638_003878 [Amoeboaphelidium occidentale]